METDKSASLLGNDELGGSGRDVSLPQLPDPHTRDDFWLICLFGCLLAIISGYLNVVALLHTTNVVTHHTGTVTWLGRWLGESITATSSMDPTAGERFVYAMYYVLILGFFILGGAICGFFLKKPAFHDSRLYGFFMIIIAVGIFITEILFSVTPTSYEREGRIMLIDYNFYNDVYKLTGVMVASFVSGIQNGLCTQISGTVVRTTHVTGLSTDVGLVIGRWAKSDPNAQSWRLKVLLPILFGYIFGCFLGTLFFGPMEQDSLLFPGIAAAVMGITWLFGSYYNKFKGCDGGIDAFPLSRS